MTNPKRNVNANAGYSLIEVLIGMMILSIAIGSAFSLSVHINRTMLSNQQVTAASNLCEYKLEELRNMPYVSIQSGNDAGTIDTYGNSPGIFSRSWEVATDAPDTGLKTVTVVVTWSQWNSERTYDMAGVIGS